jgi:tetratricopeptide (TPR) repeat protein
MFDEHGEDMDEDLGDLFEEMTEMHRNGVVFLPMIDGNVRQERRMTTDEAKAIIEGLRQENEEKFRLGARWWRQKLQDPLLQQLVREGKVEISRLLTELMAAAFPGTDLNCISGSLAKARVVGEQNNVLLDVTTSPEVLWPIQGCRILVNPDTNEPYAMPIRALDPAIEQAVTDRNNPQAWYNYAVNNKSLSYEQKIACIQRAVILQPNYPGWWYALGCHYELEGKDWYGAANAFNHVIFLYPDSANAWFSLSQLWARRGIMSKAREAYARFEALEPGRAAYLK